MYPSGDSPQATAVTAIVIARPKCIRAAIPHKPQRNASCSRNCSSVSERRFPTSHSAATSDIYRVESVSERRFPTSHSCWLRAMRAGRSVSERRFPTSHSSGGGTNKLIGVYPSGDSPQATAEGRRCASVFQCIRAAIPHKPQQHPLSPIAVAKCIRAAIPHKPQPNSKA